MSMPDHAMTGFENNEAAPGTDAGDLKDSLMHDVYDPPR